MLQPKRTKYRKKQGGKSGSGRGGNKSRRRK